MNHWRVGALLVRMPLGRVCVLDPGAAPSTVGSRHKHFLATASKGPQANGLDPVKSMIWRAKKDQMVPNHEWSKRGRHKREYVLNEFWKIFVNDRLVRREAKHTHKNAQSNSVFSNAVTVMDKTEGWEEDEMGGFKICGVHVELH